MFRGWRGWGCQDLSGPGGQAPCRESTRSSSPGWSPATQGAPWDAGLPLGPGNVGCRLHAATLPVWHRISLGVNVKDKKKKCISL